MTQTTKFRQELNASPGLSARSACRRASQCSPIPSVSKATASPSERPVRNSRYGRYRSTTLSIPDSVETHYAQPRCKLASVVDDPNGSGFTLEKYGNNQQLLGEFLHEFDSCQHLVSFAMVS